MPKHIEGAVCRSAERAPTKGAAWFIMSTPAVDRYGDIVEQVWALEEFRRNPVAFKDHYASVNGVVGSWSDVGVDPGTGSLIGKLNWASDPESQRIATLVEEGHISAVSVGFRPGNSVLRSSLPEDDPRRGMSGYVFKGPNTLLECSVVGIPANPDAVAMRSGPGVDLEALATRVADLVMDRISQIKVDRAEPVTLEPVTPDLPTTSQDPEPADSLARFFNPTTTGGDGLAHLFGG